MNITHQLQDDVSVSLTIEILPEDYLPGVESEVKKAAKKAKLPGFRDGKVPAQLVKKMYGPSLFYDVVNKIVQTQLDEYVKTHEWSLWDSPIPLSSLTDDDVALDNPKSLKLEFQLGLVSNKPLNFDIKNLKKYEIEIDDAFLQDEIMNLRIRFGTAQSKDVYEAGDSVYGRGVKTFEDDDGKMSPFGVARNFTLNPQKVEKIDFLKVFIGKKQEDVLEFSFSELYDSPEKGAELLRVSVEDYIENYHNSKFSFTIQTIEHKKLAEMNADFYNQVFKDGIIEDEADFLDQLRQRLAEMSVKWSDSYFTRDALLELQKANPVAVPLDYLKNRFLQQDRKEPLPSTFDLDADIKRQEPELQRGVIRNNCFQQLGIKIGQTEFQEYIRNHARSMFGDNIDEAMLDSYVSYVMKNEDSSRQMMEQMTDEVLTKKLSETLPIQVTSITASEFKKL